jgi:diguanylate cyclase (GGDEF)-like protein
VKNFFTKSISITFILIILTLLYLSSLQNYLLFHTITEIFSICVAFTVFLITWNSIPYIKNNYLILVGIAYLFIGFLDLFHTISYKGMPIFTDYDYYANQLWVAARFFEGVILLIASILVKSGKQINSYIVFSIFTLITTLIMMSIFVWKVFPVCFIDGIGLTPFKKYSEYIICLILLTGIAALTKNRDAFDSTVYKLLILSMICTVISEISFTVYLDNYGFYNLSGHYFKILSFYLIYKAIILKGIREPYGIIFREMKQNEQKLYEQNRLLKNLSIIDGLTGLYNHRHIYERLEEEVQRCSRHKCSFTVMILDIDHFKNINDTFGHLVGDKILSELSGILRDNTRQIDLVGRYGGEEFLIMLADTSLSEGFNVAEKIRQIVLSTEFFQKIRLTISIGLEEYSGEKVSELLEKADNKLYIAKNTGRNKCIM